MKSKKPDLRRDPITGKMVKFDRSERVKEIKRARAKIRKDELRNGNVTAPDVEPMFDVEVTTQGTIGHAAHELNELREQWVKIGPEKRAGLTGDKLMKKYRKLSLEFWHLSGKHPPPIYANL
jgi:hypothetical protein